MADEDHNLIPTDYPDLLADLKGRIHSARMRATLAANAELTLLYWDIGHAITKREQEQGWGAKVIRRLSVDLRLAFPDMKGLSPRNLLYMRQFAEAWPDRAIAQQAVAQIPWGHNVRLLDKVTDPDTRLWYAQKARLHGWSREILGMQIETRLHERQGKAVTNFDATLPAPQSDLANALLKDPYLFGFLGLEDEAQEREIEKALMHHLRDFLLELGVGFAFVGNQYRLEVGGDEFFIDMLFYHLHLRCFVVVELKAGAFKPEYAGKLNFYLSAVDDRVRHTADGPSIGLLLCREKNRVLVEYALRDIQKPMGVSAYQLTESLPENLKGKLPTVEELEAELEAQK
ncbi:PDDEXK nuclease domain-containing protein [Myxococcota bacterium]|nr:PDDEXK nuclease domain-containing protein [Myxococcota bacterium]